MSLISDERVEELLATEERCERYRLALMAIDALAYRKKIGTAPKMQMIARLALAGTPPDGMAQK